MACNPDVGKKRVVISRGSSWTVGMPVTSMIFGKESGAGEARIPRRFPKERNGKRLRSGNKEIPNPVWI